MLFHRRRNTGSDKESRWTLYPEHRFDPAAEAFRQLMGQKPTRSFLHAWNREASHVRKIHQKNFIKNGLKRLYLSEHLNVRIEMFELKCLDRNVLIRKHQIPDTNFYKTGIIIFDSLL